MWIALPTPVTMRSIIKLSGSSLRPKSTFRLPMESQLTESSRASQPPNLITTSVRTKPVTIAPMDNVALTDLLRRVKSVMTPVASSGRNKISQVSASGFIQVFNAKAQRGKGAERKDLCVFASLRLCVEFFRFSQSEFHARQVFNVRGLALAIKGHDQR